MKQKRTWDEIAGILFFLFSAGMLAFCIFFCFGSDIWYDELFTMGFTQQPVGSLISMTARDVHPPLYYLIVKLFLTAAGKSNFARVEAAKLVSCVPFLALLLFSAVKIRKDFGLLTAGLFSFLLISMPQMSGYAVEIRMYGFAMLFVTVLWVTVYELLQSEKGDKKKWVILTCCGLAACYTHYFACVAACMAYLFLLAGICRKKERKPLLKPYIISSLSCVLCYLPWLFLAAVRQMAQVQENYWIQPVSLRTLLGCIKFVFMPSFPGGKLNTVLAVLFCLLYAGFTAAGFMEEKGFFAKKGSQSRDGGRMAFVAGGILMPAGLVLFGMAASLLLRPIFVYRYMLPAMGAFWLSPAVLAGSFREKKKTVLPLLLFLLFIGLGNFRSFYGEEMWKGLQMEKALSALSQIEREDVVIYNFDQAQGVFSYYLPCESYLWYGHTEPLIAEMYPNAQSLVTREFSDEAGIAKLKALLKENGKLWFLGSGNAREEILSKWEKEGIKSEETGSVMIERYWVNIYRIMTE